ncbi:MAG: hypothetical protein ACOYM3_29820 [Terrimicrobiaceae bacterium]
MRELSYENIKNVIQYPDRVAVLNRGVHGGKLKTFEKKVDGRTLRVGAEVKGTECWIATAFYED